MTETPCSTLFLRMEITYTDSLKDMPLTHVPQRLALKSSKMVQIVSMPRKICHFMVVEWL